jgi:serine/threonine protein kinase
VIDANVLPGEEGPPYILFEYVQGEDVADLIRDDRLDAEDVLLLYRQVAEGLVHLHREGLYHCDIKPHNLLWTIKGAKITDFNVSVRSEDNGHGGGSQRYLPPDLDLSETPSPSELADRDLYALGLTIYEALTGSYPWKGSAPPPGTPAPDPRDGPGGSDLVPELTVLVQKAIAPKRSERFASASELLEALKPITRARREPATETAGILLSPDLAGSVQPNTNSFVSYLQTLYSQSRKTNAGTRGLNELGRLTYIPTLLDENLIPDVIAGKFKLVLITGNAGDGKTAFLQQLEVEAGTQAQLQSSEPLPNGRRFSTTDRTFITNYDGSQDEDERKNDDVLDEFFRPFSGTNPDAWPTDETRLIAINEGRLVDFLKTARDEFPALLAVVEESLRTGEDKHGIAVVNLNWRSVVASPISDDNSILERQLRALIKPKYWQACQSCDLKDKCYVYHNVQTFQDRTAAPQVIERLKTLYTLSHLRGRLHITIRDLRSALSFMLTSARDCTEIHALYDGGRLDLFAAGFYFNSWMAADTNTADRLLQLLKGVDVGSAADPRLDRGLDFISPALDQSRFSFSGRGSYDHEVLRSLYETLPRDFTGKPSTSRAVAHRHFLSMARRRISFERRDTSWSSMLPYRSAERMLAMMRGQRSTELALQDVLHAINRGEGLLDPTRLGNSLALQVRQVARGTVSISQINSNFP